jgi:hypothetical protein
MITNGYNEWLTYLLKEKKPLFSEPLVIHSVVTGAVAIAGVNNSAFNPIGYLIHWFNIQIPPGIPPFTITDNLGRVCFSFSGNTNLSGHYPFTWWNGGANLQFSCSSIQVIFSVGFQYVTTTDSVIK